jgi:hypothetical protein
MARPSVDDTEEKPLDPAAERVRRKLVRFVAVNLGLLFFAVMAVLVAVVYKSFDGGTPAEAVSEIPEPDGAPLELDLPLPAGAKVLGHALSGNRISLDLELADGRRSLLIYDVAARRIVARIALSQQ